MILELSANVETKFFCLLLGIIYEIFGLIADIIDEVSHFVHSFRSCVFNLLGKLLLSTSLMLAELIDEVLSTVL